MICICFIGNMYDMHYCCCSYSSSFCHTPYQLVRNFQLRAELTKITSFERARKTEQEYEIF